MLGICVLPGGCFPVDFTVFSLITSIFMGGLSSRGSLSIPFSVRVNLWCIYRPRHNNSGQKSVKPWG